MKCKICGKEFELLKENKKFVKTNNLSSIFSNVYIKEAFDCPHCGCQNVVNDYYGEILGCGCSEIEELENGKNE